MNVNQRIYSKIIKIIGKYVFLNSICQNAKFQLIALNKKTFTMLNIFINAMNQVGSNSNEISAVFIATVANIWTINYITLWYSWYSN